MTEQHRRTPRQNQACAGAPGRRNLHMISEEAYDQAEYAMLTGIEMGNIGTGRPGEVGYMPADPPNYDAAIRGPDAEGWIVSMGKERKSLIGNDVFDWVYPPKDAQLIPSRYLFKWKYNQDGVPFRQKTRVVVQGSHKADTGGTDKAAPVASLESVRPMITAAAKYVPLLK